MAPRSLTSTWLVASALMAGLVLITLWAQALNPLTSDVAWLMTVAERMLDGQRLYIDIAETNPPMSAWLYLPWVALARWLHLDADATVAATTLVFAFLCMGLCDRIIAPLFDPQWRPIAWTLGTAILCVVPGTAFAQREHVAVLALLPSLCALYASQSGRRETWLETLALGLLAGLALALKPQLGLGLLLPALVIGWQSRSFAPILAWRHVIAGVIVVAYSATVLVFYPEFGNTMLPLINDTYLASRRPILQQLINAHVMLWLVCLFWFTWLNCHDLGRSAVFVPLLAALGFFVAYLLPGKGFAYHMLPANSVMLLALILSALNHWRSGTWRRPMLITAAVAVLLLGLPGPAWFTMNDWQGGLVDAVDDYGPLASIALISDDLGMASPLHRSIKAELINDGPSLWAARGALIEASHTDDPARRQYLLGLSDADRVAIRERIETENPDILLVSDGDIDWQAWADQDLAFKALFAGYRPVASVPFKQDTVNVLVRNDLAAR